LKNIIQTIAAKTSVESVLLTAFVILLAATTFTIDPFGIKQAVLDVLSRS